MAEQKLKLPDDSANTGKQLRTQELTVGAEVVQQEVVTVAKSDGTLLAPLTDTELRAAAVPVSAAALPLPTGATAEATLAAMSAKLPSVLVSDRVKVDGSGVTQPVSGPLTDAQLRAAVVPVSGSVSIAGGTVDISDGGFSITVDGLVTVQDDGGSITVDGPLTDAQLRATAIPVSGTVTASGPLTDAQLRASAVPVSGTVTASGPLTDTQLRAAAVPTTPKPATSGGCSIYRLLSAATTNGASVKASAGQLYGWYIFNGAATTRYVKLYNKASAPTVGTDTPVMTFPVPPGGGAVAPPNVPGIAFATGIALAITSGIADADTGAVAANDVAVNLWHF